MIVKHGVMPGQVLQRLKSGAKAAVSGACDSSGEVLVTISSGAKALKGWNAKKAGRAADGNFSAKLDGIPVGGPYTIKFAVGKENCAVKNVFVGDVWILAGQSNMQGCGNMDIAPQPHPKVHALYMDRHWDVAREPIHFLQESPDPIHNTTPMSAADIAKARKASLKGVGPGIFFGREMVKRSGGVPQGLICTAHGGTSMQQWSPEKKNEGGNSLYGSMLLSWQATGQPVSGVLWYQGESDTNEADAAVYTQRMKELINAMRADFKQPGLPFLLVQIGKFFTFNNAPRWWNSIQDQEANLYKVLKNVACVTALDLGLDDAIHVGTEDYARLGVRLARLADYYVYGNKKELPAPEFTSLRKFTENGVGVIELTFKNVVGKLQSKGTPNGFVLIDQNHQDTNTVYKIQLNGNKVRLEADLWQSSNGLLMYGHGFSPYVNITDARDMAIPGLGTATLNGLTTTTGFVTQWWVSNILPANKPLDAWDAPLPSTELGLRSKQFSGLFVDMHLDWQGNSGQAVFFSSLELSEDMQLNLRFGYDGPARVWVDDTSVFTDMSGTNPALPDAKIVPLSLKKGTHKIAVAMDLNGGKAWGFFMRFDRTDVTPQKIKERALVLPKFTI
jgi:hypothetical protein